MSSKNSGELRLNQKSYVVVPAEEYSQIEVEAFRRAMGIPELGNLWVGYLIRQHRTRLGLTQEELGSRTNSDQKHIDKIENGTIKRPKDPLLRNLIAVLGDDFRIGLSLLGITLTKLEDHPQQI